MSNFNLDNVTQINILASFSVPQSPISQLSGGGIYEFSVNLNGSVVLEHRGSHIHVNMNM